jgi:hypothetical protein
MSSQFLQFLVALFLLPPTLNQQTPIIAGKVLIGHRLRARLQRLPERLKKKLSLAKNHGKET